MPHIQTIASLRRNRISVAVPKVSRRPSFVDALLSCPKLAEGEELGISRDHTDMGREVYKINPLEK